MAMGMTPRCIRRVGVAPSVDADARLDKRVDGHECLSLPVDWFRDSNRAREALFDRYVVSPTLTTFFNISKETPCKKQSSNLCRVVSLDLRLL